MKILILGASGLVGSRIFEKLERRGYEVYGTYCRGKSKEQRDNMLWFDIENVGMIESVLSDISPDIVISTLRGNFEKQALLHQRMSSFLKGKENGRLIYFSSANAFDDASMLQKAHYEQETPKAESEYGKHKIQCETVVRKELGENGIIIRIPFVYGRASARTNALKNSHIMNEPVHTWSGLCANITSDEQIAQWIEYIIAHDLKGTFHIGTTDMGDYFEFQKYLALKLGVLEPIFDVKKCEPKIVLAVLPGRKEIPLELQKTMRDIVENITG